MKKLLTLILSFAMIFTAIVSGTVFAQEAQSVPNNIRDYLFEVSDDMSDEEYMWTVEKNFRMIKSMEMIFTKDSFKAFNKTHRTGSREDMQACDAAVDSLVLQDPIEERIWFLWDFDNMPVKDGVAPSPETIDAESELDFAEFVPFVINFLQEDQSNVKGNVILVSGGGYSFRSNAGESYKTWPIFYDLGYNVYILQRRISPYAAEDTFMDLQRTIRLVRYHGEQDSYGGLDMIAIIGWSGGGGTVNGTIGNCYGTLTPADVYDPTYVPDEIDLINSDVDVACPVYGVGGNTIELVLQNPHLPAFYLCVGSEDGDGPVHQQALYDKLTEIGVPARIFIVPGGQHGFGPGGGSKGGDGSERWPYEADELMQENRGRAASFSADAGQETESTEAQAQPSAEAVSAADYGIPEGYTKAKTFDGTFGFGDAEIIVAANDDETAFYITFEAFDEEQILEGTVEDGICSVDYDDTGFMTGDCQLIWDDALASENPWQPVE